MTVTPASPLPGNAQINVQVNGIRDLAGNFSNFIFQSFLHRRDDRHDAADGAERHTGPGTTGVGRKRRS